MRSFWLGGGGGLALGVVTFRDARRDEIIHLVLGQADSTLDTAGSIHHFRKQWPILIEIWPFQLRFLWNFSSSENFPKIEDF